MSDKQEKQEKKVKAPEEQKTPAAAPAQAPEAAQKQPKKDKGAKKGKPAEGAPAEEAAAGGKKQKAAKKPAEEKPKDEIKYIVRISNADLDGTQTVQYALTGIKGVGVRISRLISKKADVDPTATMGYLQPDQVERLKSVVDNLEANIPAWMINRRRDIYTGEDRHLTGVDLTLSVKEDINLMKKIRCYKGIRHERGQKVRGQRTKSTGRTGATVGVVRKKEAPGAAAAAPEKK